VLRFSEIGWQALTNDEGQHFTYRGLGPFGVTAGNKALAAIPICR